MRLFAATVTAFASVALFACSSGDTNTGGGGSTTTTSTTSDTATGTGGTGGSAPEVSTKQGAVVGEVTPSGKTRRFLGIPFAAPPTGQNRFRPPQPPAAWTDKRDATQFGPKCPQYKSSLGGGTPSYDTSASEDCLTLNVWSPLETKSPRPVMVWFHGGGWTMGAGSEDVYEGTNLSEAGDVVIVTLNYRLGPLGFAAHAGLTAEDPAHAASGNYGLLDQRAALQWVKDNIAAFGGDPNDVTIFGESAGGMAVCMQLASPGSAGLFHHAIVESGICTLVPLPVATVAEAQGKALADKLGCTGTDAAAVSCMRGKTAEEIIEALPLKAEIIFGDGVAWLPQVDGLVLTDQPRATLAAGKAAKVPLLLGTNSDEGTIFVKGFKAHFPDAASLQATLAGAFSDAIATAIADHYGFATATDFDTLAIQILGDGIVCDGRRTARAHEGAGNKVFQYYFSHPFQVLLPGLGAFHSAELPFVWGNKYLYSALQDAEKPLSAAMQGYWTRFAASGDPNTGAPASAVNWPAFTTAGDQYLGLDLTITAGSGLRKDACDFFDATLP